MIFQFRTSLFALVLSVMAVGPAQTSERSVALILDASGSMRAKLASGVTRIDAAKDAVEGLVEGLPDGVRLALRAYGHQSHRRKKDCRDTQLLTEFQPIGDNRNDVVKLARGLKAQGYTPISLVLEQSANDLKSESDAPARVVILVSDGKETCEGDPCAVAKTLAAADAGLVVHTIGFAVDVAARYQLQCIARKGRGKYFEADTTSKLIKRLSTAVKTAAVAPAAEIKSESDKPGTLRLTNPSASRHDVISVETGKTVTKLSAVRSSVALPAGFYNVRFGSQLWRSIEVKDGESTKITTSIVAMPAASYRGHEIRDWETVEVVGKLASSRNSMNLLPSSYTVSFGKLTVPFQLEAGQRLDIQAASVTFKGLPINSRTIFDSEGNEVTSVAATRSSATLPPGSYVLDLQPTKVPFEIKAGDKLKLKLK